MRVLISIIDWEYPSSRGEIKPQLWNLHDKNALMALVLMYGNGVIRELRAQGESDEALDVLRGIISGTGNSQKIELSSAEKLNLWLYQAGDECYRQPMKSGGYTFIHPRPQPHKFHSE